MKPSPHSAMQREIVSGEASIFTPSSFSTSAEPEREEIARLPCFATGTPAPATTKAAQVEMLKVPLPSPPVPQVSMAPSGARTVSTLARMARAAPAISSTVSPRTRSPMTSAPICAGVAAPDITRSKASAASSWLQAGAGSDLGDRSPQIGEDRCPCQHGIRGHRPLLLGSTLSRAALPGQDRGSWRGADARAQRRCSRGGTARRARDSACAAGP